MRNEGTDWMEAHLPPHVEVFYRVQDIKPSRFKLILCVSPQVPNFPEMPMICYVPCVVHLGIGLARLAGPVRKVEKEIMNTLKEYGIMPQSIASISTIKAKSDEPVVKALQKKFPVYFYTAEELAEIEVPHPSKTVMKHMGTPSVSEAAALLSANNSRLLVPKKKGENYTVAAALDIRTVRQGHIEIVGAGPGDPDLVSVRGRQMLERADLILYAGSLVPRELTLCAKAGATVLSSASMDLEEQFEVMKKFYDKGKFIVRLHTGDPCIYGAIQEQMNYFDQHGMSYHTHPRHILLPGGGSCLEVAVHHSGKSAKHHPNTRRRTYAHARTRKATSHGTFTKYHVHLPQCKHCEAGAGRTVAGISGNYPRSCLLPLDMERRTNIQGGTQRPCQNSEGK